MTRSTDPNDPSADPHNEWQPVGKYCPHGLSWRVWCWCCTQEHDEAMRKIQTESPLAADGGDSPAGASASAGFLGVGNER